MTPDGFCCLTGSRNVSETLSDDVDLEEALSDERWIVDNSCLDSLFAMVCAIDDKHSSPRSLLSVSHMDDLCLIVSNSLVFLRCVAIAAVATR